MRSNLCHYFLFIPSGLLSFEDHIEGNFWQKFFPCLPLLPQQPAELALHLQIPSAPSSGRLAFPRKGIVFSLFHKFMQQDLHGVRHRSSSMKRLMGHHTCAQRHYKTHGLPLAQQMFPLGEGMTCLGRRLGEPANAQPEPQCPPLEGGAGLEPHYF